MRAISIGQLLYQELFRIKPFRRYEDDPIDEPEIQAKPKKIAFVRTVPRIPQIFGRRPGVVEITVGIEVDERKRFLPPLQYRQDLVVLSDDMDRRDFLQTGCNQTVDQLRWSDPLLLGMASICPLVGLIGEHEVDVYV